MPSKVDLHTRPGFELLHHRKQRIVLGLVGAFCPPDGELLLRQARSGKQPDRHGGDTGQQPSHGLPFNSCGREKPATTMGARWHGNVANRGANGRSHCQTHAAGYSLSGLGVCPLRAYSGIAEQRGHPMSSKLRLTTSRHASASHTRPPHLVIPPVPRAGIMRLLLLILLWLPPSGAMANDELITVQSAHSAPETARRLALAITANGWTILGTVDHAFHVAQYGVKIQARTTISFAFMASWTQHLIENPTIAIEVPHRLLVWEDHEGVWVTRNTARYYLRNILRRHEAKGLEGPIMMYDDRLSAMIDNVTR